MSNIETHVTNAYQSTITAELSPVGTVMTIADPSGLVVPFYIVIEPDSASQREYMLIDQLVGSTATIDSRYLAGSAAASGLTHPAGSVIRMSIMSQHLTDINDRADDLQAQVTALSDHGGLVGLADDDHPQYYNATRHTKSLHDALGIDHGLLTGRSDDDHTQYHTDARAVTWHDGDDHSALPSAAVLAHQALIDHGTIAGKADDDHPQYLLASGARGVAGAFVPDSDNARDLGTEPLSWRRLYVYDIYDEGGNPAIDVGARTLVGTWVPFLDVTSDLGSDSLSWRRLYTESIFDEGGNARIDTSVPLLSGTWFSGTFMPNANGTFDLGGVSNRWLNGYINNLEVGAGSLASPVIHGADPDTGIHFPAAGNMQFGANGNAMLGVTFDQVQAPGVHDATTGSAANVVVASTGSHQLLRSTSALRYKRDVREAYELADIEVVPTRHFRPDDGRERYGLIADWLAGQDRMLGRFGDDGRIEDYDDRAIMAVFAAKLNRLERLVLA